MREPQRGLLSGLKHEIGSLGADLRRMLQLRWELARLEVRAAVGTVRRLAIALAVFAVAVLSALPILAVTAAATLGSPEGLSFVQWLLVFGLGLLIVGTTGAWLAWRRFRRRFVGMEQTLEEFHEDLVWLGEWIQSGKAEQDAGENPQSSPDATDP